MANVAKELGILIAAKDEASGPLKATKEGIEGVQTAAKAPGLAKMGDEFRKLRESLVDPVKLRAIQTEMARIQAEAAKGPDATKMKQLRAEVDKLETSYKQATSSGADKFRGGLTNVAQAISPVQLGVAGLAVTVVAGAKNAIDAGISWETAFAGVRKTVDATDEELAQFSAGIRKMATEIPASREEIARVAEAAGQLGIRKEALLGFTRTMIDLGVATNMSSEQAADSLARLANITRMPQENFDRLGSTVVALGNKMAATESEIVSMAMRLGSAGNQVGMSEAQILSFAAALSSLGIEAEMGGTAFSRTIADIANAVGKGGKDLEKFAEIAGMSADAFATKFRVDAAGALVLFLQGLDRVKQGGGNLFAVLEDLGMSEMRQSDTVRRLSGAYEKVNDALAIGNKAWAENTALTKEAEERYKTTASQVKVMESKFSELGVKLFEVTAPALHAVLNVLGAIPKALSDVTESVSKGQVAFDGVGPSLGNLVYIAEKITTEMREWQATMPVSASRIQELSKEGKTFQEAYDIASGEAKEFAAAALVAAEQVAELNKQATQMDRDMRNSAAAIATATVALNKLSEARERDARAIAEKQVKAMAEIDALISTSTNRAIDDHQERMERMDRETIARDKAAAEQERETNKAISDAKRAADEAIRDAERIAEKARDTTWEIGALGRKMVKEVGDALAKETDLWEAYGNRWIEKWSDVDAAIQKTYQDRETALAGIEESESISKDRDARKKELNDRINGEKKVFDLRMDDTEFHHREELAKGKALTDYQKILNSGASQEEKNNAWEIYRQRLDDLVQEHQAFDAEVQWRLSQEKIRADREAVWANEQAALEKTLHEEELTRQRAAIGARQQAEEARINAEWAEWQIVEKEKTTKAAEEAKARAKANLEAWRDEFIDKLAKEGEPGIERFMGMVAGKWADALASMGAAAASASSGSSESLVSAAPNGGTTSPITVISSGPATSTTTSAEGWVPSFAAGGIVPGPVGAPRLVMAHGGEPILPVGQGAPIVFNLNGNYVGFDRSSLEELARQLKPYLDSLVRL